MDFETLETAISRSDLIHVIESTMLGPETAGPEFDLELGEEREDRKT